MSDSIKKYHELVEEGKIKPNCETTRNLRNNDILNEYKVSKDSSESDTSMSTYFVSKFLNWLTENYNVTKRNHKL